MVEDLWLHMHVLMAEILVEMWLNCGCMNGGLHELNCGCIHVSHKVEIQG